MLKFLSNLKTTVENGSPKWRARAVRFVLCVLTLLLLSATWRLWIPQQSFPRVPLFDWAGKIPWQIQLAILAECVFCLLCGASLEMSQSLASVAWIRWNSLLFSLGIGLLFCLDQHRLQPWAYQAVLMFLVLAFVEARRALTLLRILTLSIYLYSALSKLDYSFLHSMGQQFTETLLNLVGLSHWQWPTELRLLFALAFPLGELFVAVSLSLPRTRRIGVYAALIMHGVLLLILGPLGMRQQPAVLIWNVQFMLLAVLLFYGPRRGRETEESHSATAEQMETPSPNQAEKDQPEQVTSTWLRWPTHFLILIAVLLPLLKSSGYWDHWLAWDLYSPGTSKAQVFLHPSDVEHLPPGWKKYAQAMKNDPNWVQIRTDLWSLEELSVPIYPQARFQLGVTAAVSDHLPAGHDAWIVVSSATNRFTGKRKQAAIKTRPQLEAALDQYWLNARPAGE